MRFSHPLKITEQNVISIDSKMRKYCMKGAVAHNGSRTLGLLFDYGNILFFAKHLTCIPLRIVY